MPVLEFPDPRVYHRRIPFPCRVGFPQTILRILRDRESLLLFIIVIPYPDFPISGLP